MSGMPGRERTTWVLACAWLFAGTWFATAANPWVQLASMVLLLVLLSLIVANFVWVFTKWGSLGARALVPLLVAVVALPLPVMIGRELKPKVFDFYRPDYEAFIARIERNEIAVGPESKILLYPGNGRVGDAYYVLARREADGLVVEFLTESGWPVKHRGYLYAKNGEIRKGSFFDERWPRRRELRPHWFRIAD